MKFEKTAVVFLAAAIILFLTLSSVSLYVFPVVNGYWWYGGETWMMLNAKNLLLHGRMFDPLAVGSSLSASPGFFAGSKWLCALFYGLPQLLSSVHVDIVNLGRNVTFMLSLSVVIMLAYYGARLKVSALANLLSVALLVTAKTFIVQSHSASADIMTALVILIIVGRYARVAKNRTVAVHFRWFAIGAIFLLIAIGVGLALVVLILPLTIYIAWYFGAFHSWRKGLTLFSGAAASLAVCAIFYLLLNGSLHLFGGSYHEFTAGDRVPDVASLTLHEHTNGNSFFQGAMAFCVILPLILVSEFTLRRRKIENHPRSFVFGACVSVAFCCVLLPSKLAHTIVFLIPLACLSLAMQFDSWKQHPNTTRFAPLACIALIGTLVFIELPQLMHARGAGRILTQNNIAGVQAALEYIGRRPPDSVEKPYLLAQAPSISELLRDTGYIVMNESFVLHPANTDPIDTLLSRQGIDYVLDYHQPLTGEYAKMISRISPPMFSRIAFLNDRHVNYYTGDLGPIDTLSVYAYRP